MGVHARIDLVRIAEYVRHQDGMGYAELVEWISTTFACGTRASKDAISILCKGYWAESRPVERDRRRRTVHITAGGHEDLATNVGRSAIRGARRRYSTCSRRGRRIRAYQQALGIEEVAQQIWADQQRGYRSYAKGMGAAIVDG